MPASGELFRRSTDAPVVPTRLPLVVLLTGFTDAGSTVASLIQYMRDTLVSSPIMTFANDVLLDYRARRPIVSFDQDHLTDFAPPRLELSLTHDAIGQPFLLLAGYEPDFAWEAFADVVLAIADELQVSGVTWAHAIPMPVPHTRPLGTTVSGNRADLTAAHSVWQPHTQVPATAGHLLEYRFVATGLPTVGFVLLVPHYLADTEFPGSVIAGLDKVSAATGLVFATDEVQSENRAYVTRVGEQVSGNDELQRMISGLEERYDAYMSGLEVASPGVALLDGTPLPSADELAAELERYLASRSRGDDDKTPPKG